MELNKLPAHTLKEKILSKEISIKEVLDSYYNKIEETKELNTFINLTEKSAYETAEKIQNKINNNEEVPYLAGIPIGIKDNINVKDVNTTCGSKILENYVSPYNAGVIERVNAAGMIILGKLNMDEFAMGSSNETSYFGPVKNPYDITKIPGGSSGGSAASVSAYQVPLTLGSDTGGSIRQPASLCGVVGMKPTYGRVSRYGLVAFASSLDQIGPFANNVTDTAMLLNVISGYDKRDSTSINLDVPDYTANLNQDVRGKKIGIPKEYFEIGLSPEIKEKLNTSIDKMKSELGVEVIDISLPHTEYAVSVYYLLATAEASSNLARFDGVKYGYRTKDSENLIDMYEKTRSEGFGNEVKRRIMLGTYVLSAGYYDAYYKKAQKVRTLIKQDFEKAFEKCDFIVTPTSPTEAFNIGEKTSNPLDMYLSDIYTISVNLAGLPAISLPCGTVNSLPIGLQIIGNVLKESDLLNISYKYEQIN